MSVVLSLIVSWHNVEPAGKGLEEGLSGSGWRASLWGIVLIVFTDAGKHSPGWAVLFSGFCWGIYYSNRHEARTVAKTLLLPDLHS